MSLSSSRPRPISRTYHLAYAAIAAAIAKLKITDISEVPTALFMKSINSGKAKSRGGSIKANARKAYRRRATKRARKLGHA